MGRYHRVSLRIRASGGHNHNLDSGLGLPTTRTSCSTLHITQSQRKGDRADLFHCYIGDPPCDRNRNSTVYTAVRYVTNTQPDIQCAWWDRSIGRTDEVYVCSIRVSLVITQLDRLLQCLSGIAPVVWSRGHSTPALTPLADGVIVQLQRNGTCDTSKQHAQSHTSSNRFLAGPLSRRRRGRWSGHERAA